MNARVVGVALIALVIGYFLGRVGSSANSACAPTLNPIPAATPSGFQTPTPAPSPRAGTPATASPAQPAQAGEPTILEKPKFESENGGHPPRFIVLDFSEKNVGQMEVDAVSFGHDFAAKKTGEGWSFKKVPTASLFYRLGLRSGDSIYSMQVDDLRAKRPDLETRVRAVLDGLSK